MAKTNSIFAKSHRMVERVKYMTHLREEFRDKRFRSPTNAEMRELQKIVDKIYPRLTLR